MAINSKKIVITTTLSELLIVRSSERSTITEFCPLCGTEVEMLTLDDAVTLTALTTRIIYSHAESGAIHSSEHVDGRLRVCRPSLEALSGPV